MWELWTWELWTCKVRPPRRSANQRGGDVGAVDLHGGGAAHGVAPRTQRAHGAGALPCAWRFRVKMVHFYTARRPMLTASSGRFRVLSYVGINLKSYSAF